MLLGGLDAGMAEQQLNGAQVGGGEMNAVYESQHADEDSRWWIWRWQEDTKP